MALNGAVENIVMRAGLVLELYDDFTDKSAKSEFFRVYSPQKISIIKKTGGYFVCMDLPNYPVDICIESPYFYPVTITVNSNELGNKLPVRKVRMIPNTNYPLAGGFLRVTGNAQPNSAVYMVCITQDKYFQLIYDYNRKSEDRISIYQSTGSSLEGKRLLIVSENGKLAEMFMVGELISGEKDCYRLSHPLVNDYRKIKTKLYPVFEGRTDKDGWYQLLLKEKRGRLIGYNMLDDGSSVSRELELDGSQHCKLDFTK